MAWTPASVEERSYYDRLFQLADVSNAGKLLGESVVSFLAKSSLPFPVLKEVSSQGVALAKFDDITQSSAIYGVLNNKSATGS